MLRWSDINGAIFEEIFPKVYRKMKEDTNISNYSKFDSQLLTTFTSSLYIAGLIASLFASSVTRAFGRKASILVRSTAFLAGSALRGRGGTMWVPGWPGQSPQFQICFFTYFKILKL